MRGHCHAPSRSSPQGRNSTMDRRSFFAGGVSLFALSRTAHAIENGSFQLRDVELIGGASKLADRDSSAGYLVSLTQPGHGLKFIGAPVGSKLAVHYASLSVGTISITVNDGPTRKMNVHSSGALTSSYLPAIVDLAIPSNATVTIKLESDDVGVNIDRVTVGGELGLPPDIWNLPALPVAAGPFFPDWKALGRA